MKCPDRRSDLRSQPFNLPVDPDRRSATPKVDDVWLRGLNGVDADDDRLLSIEDLAQAENVIFLLEDVNWSDQDEDECLMADCAVFVNEYMVDLAHLVTLEANVVATAEDISLEVPKCTQAVSDSGEANELYSWRMRIFKQRQKTQRRHQMSLRRRKKIEAQQR
jgi:hypothetical protein